MAANPATLAAPIIDDPQPRPLDASLRHLEKFLSLLGFCVAASSSPLCFVLSCSAFLLWGLAAPAATFCLSRSFGCSAYQVDGLEICAVVFEASIAAVSLACVSKNLYKYGIRRFLFVDRHHGELEKYQNELVRKIQVSFG